MEAKDAWQAYLSFVQHAESISWNRFYNFLMFSSILVLAWATIYSQPSPPPNAKYVLCSMCVIGMLSGVSWSFLGYRGRKFVNKYLERAKALETHDSIPEHWRVGTQTLADVKSVWFRWFGSLLHLTLVPVFVAVLYALLFAVSFNMHTSSQSPSANLPIPISHGELPSTAPRP